MNIIGAPPNELNVLQPISFSLMKNYQCLRQCRCDGPSPIGYNSNQDKEDE
jgi:hypothetical protein